MTATATHDTKRGEDARARIAALSEIPGEWTSAVARWKVLNAPHLALDGNLRAPSATFEYMLYQTLLGAWPLVEPADAGFVARIQAYALKAAREGKEETSWLNPHEAYENGVKSFIAKILDPAQSGEFLEALNTLARRVALLGALNALSQLTLKATLCRACPTFTRAPNSGICRWSIPTTAARWIFPRDTRRWARWTTRIGIT
ncbi:maltooligosyltrehalose synthase [Bradyrhizobium sp. GM22.5]